MLSETAPPTPVPRVRRVPDAAPGRILFGIASPSLPLDGLRWPSWLNPLDGSWRAPVRSSPSRRSE
ncbi:MAG TPA: hypothetical protein VLY85_02610 [Thermoplasmata archaeon]|nr:hypothetical protein [Thermoplasmata archaeon]